MSQATLGQVPSEQIPMGNSPWCLVQAALRCSRRDLTGPISQTGSGLTGVPPDPSLEVGAGLCPSCLLPDLVGKIPFLLNRANLALFQHS